MKTARFILSALAGLMLLLSACSPQAVATTAPPTAMPATQAPAATSAPAVPVTGGQVVSLGKNDALGSLAPGDVVGQDVGSVWFVISPSGDKVESAQATEAPAAASGGATVNLGKNDTLGSFLVDDKGMTLYLFTKDTPNTSVCYDKCATAWPPLLTTGDPVAGDGVDASKFGTTTRTDGSVQVTYNGWPLYYYAKDKAPGDVVGQEVGGVWYVVSAAGDKVTTP